MIPFILPIILVLLPLIFIKFIYSTIWVPYKIQRHFYKQGIKGPGYRLIYGNMREFEKGYDLTYNKPMGSLSHDIAHRVDPAYHNWAEKYGKNLLFWNGTIPSLAVADPEMLKEIFLNKSGHVRKIKIPPLADQLFGKGLIDLHDEKWAIHRRVANPAFMVDQVKAWIPEIVGCVQMVLKKWEEEMGGKNEIELEMVKEFMSLSGEITSQTAFGSNYEKGKNIFQLQDLQAALTVKAIRSAYIPGLRFLPTSENRMRWRIAREVRRQIRTLIEEDQNLEIDSKCLLSFLLRGGIPKEEVIDECQTFYFAGKEAVAMYLSWTLLLVASSQEWQKKAREEVFQVCKNDGFPNADNLNDLKIVGWIINEALRLYPSVPALNRLASKDIKVGNLDIPAGTQFYLPMASVHHDPELWGPDANEFNPQRFAEPRKHLAAYFPFSLGSRVCIAQHFSIMEGKVILAMILKHFTFEISPSYVHAPVRYLTSTPEFGAQIVFRRI